MKRSIALLAAICLLLGALAPPAGAAATPRFYGANAECFPGGNVAVTVKGENLDKLAGIDLYAQYPEGFSVVSQAAAGLAAGTSASTSNDPDQRLAAFSMIHADGISGSGNLWRIMFRVGEDVAPGTYTIALAAGDVYDSDLADVAVTTGTIRVTVKAPAVTVPTVTAYSSVTGSPKIGETATVRVYTGNVQKLASMEMTVDYDKTLLRLDSVKLGSQLLDAEGAVYDINTQTAGVVRIGYMHLGSIFGYGELETLTFEGAVPPTIDGSIFSGVTATAYYPCSGQWTEDHLQQYNGTITWERSHSYADGVCAGCGAVDPDHPAFTSASVVLDAVLGVRFYTPNTTGTVRIAVGDGEAVEVAASAQSAKPDHREFKVSVFAQNMMKDITATLYGADGNVLDTKVFRMADYVSAIQQMSDQPQTTKALAQAALHYCQYAANIKGNYEGTLNALPAIPQNAFADYPFFVDGGAPVGATIHCYLEDACELRIRLKTDLYTVKVDGVLAEPQLIDGTYVYTTGRLLPQAYDEPHTFELLLDGETVFIGTYSVLAYLGRTLDIGSLSADMRNLLVAMYHYHVAAADCRGA